jgi:hypothetical protein
MDNLRQGLSSIRQALAISFKTMFAWGHELGVPTVDVPSFLHVRRMAPQSPSAATGPGEMGFSAMLFAAVLTALGARIRPNSTPREWSPG